MQAVAAGKLSLTSRLESHLDNCLVCRACEYACPAGVPYGELIDAAREMTSKKGAFSPLSQADTILDNLARLRRWRPLISLYQRSGLQTFVRTCSLPRPTALRQLEQFVPKLPRRRRWRQHYPALKQERGKIALFTGCTGKIIEEDTVAAALKLLTHLGYSVTIPAEQECCGIMHLHGGDIRKAHMLAHRNLKSFQSNQWDAIIYFASGCGTQLLEYKKLPGLTREQQEQARHFSDNSHEICQFIDRVAEHNDIPMKPLRRTVAVHTPCSMKHPRHQPDKTITLIKRIPQVKIRELPGNQHCCGAAGEYLLRHPDISDALITPKTDAIKQLNPDIITTTNIGCALHFMAAFRKKNITAEVIHPITLLAQQLIKR